MPNPTEMAKCGGSWGIVIKEWKIFMASYPPSAKNLNPTTKQLDVDVYDEKGNLVKIAGMPANQGGNSIDFLPRKVPQVRVDIRVPPKLPRVYSYLNKLPQVIISGYTFGGLFVH